MASRSRLRAHFFTLGSDMANAKKSLELALAACLGQNRGGLNCNRLEHGPPSPRAQHNEKATQANIWQLEPASDTSCTPCRSRSALQAGGNRNEVRHHQSLDPPSLFLTHAGLAKSVGSLPKRVSIAPRTRHSSVMRRQSFSLRLPGSRLTRTRAVGLTTDTAKESVCFRKHFLQSSQVLNSGLPCAA